MNLLQEALGGKGLYTSTPGAIVVREVLAVLVLHVAKLVLVAINY